MNTTLDTSNLLLGLVFGSIGIGYCIYGRKQRRHEVFVAGLLLCGMPYFIDNNWLLLAISVAVMFAPKFIKL
jgi:hypothetical protein